MIRFSMLALLAALLVAAPAGAAEDFGAFEPGQRIYDRAGVLSAGDVQDLETRALAVERAGAPTIVYVRIQDASQSDTREDARELMDAWDVQSVPDARDGLVIFLNLKPDDVQRGEAALYAGERHVDDRTLSESALQRIFDREMRPALADGRMAAGIGAGLDASRRAVIEGPPQPSAAQLVAADLARVPLNIVLGGLGLLLLGWSIRTWQAQARPVGSESDTTVLPDELEPALAGGLVSGHVRDAQIEGTLLDLAGRGALRMEAVDRKHVQLRLLNRDRVRGRVEHAVWTALDGVADQQGVVPHKRLAKVRERWQEAKRALREELEQRGWFDAAIGDRRRPLYIAGAIALVLTAAGAVVAAIGREPVGVIGPLVLAICGLAALLMAAELPSTTLEGARVAQGWRNYRRGLKQTRKLPEPLFDLGEALPYAVAMGSASLLEGHLKRASERGYAPAWFVREGQAANASAGFFPYWVTLHTSMGASSSSGSASASSGGASGGGSF